MMAEGTSPEAVTVLLVDDDEVDVMVMKRAFERSGIINPLLVASDGLEALEMMRGEGGHDPLERPYIVLLDLNMPRMDGFEFLEEVRADPELKNAVIFVLTTSSADRDRELAYNRNVAGYLVKSNVGSGFLDVLTMLKAYWNVVRLP